MYKLLNQPMEISMIYYSNSHLLKEVSLSSSWYFWVLPYALRQINKTRKPYGFGPRSSYREDVLPVSLYTNFKIQNKSARLCANTYLLGFG